MLIDHPNLIEQLRDQSAGDTTDGRNELASGRERGVKTQAERISPKAQHARHLVRRLPHSEEMADTDLHSGGTQGSECL